MTDVKNQETSFWLDVLIMALLLFIAFAMLAVGQASGDWSLIAFLIMSAISLYYFYYRIMHVKNGNIVVTFLLIMSGLAVSAFFGHFQLVGLLMFGTLGVLLLSFFGACLIERLVGGIKKSIKRFRGE